MSAEAAAPRGLLRYQADRRTLAFVAAFFVLSFTGYAMHPMPWWLAVPWVAATSVMSFCCAVITHNTIHAPIFYDRTLNRLFQFVLTLAYGHPVSAFVPGHNLSHHLHTQSRRDVMRTTKLRWKINLLNQLFFLPTLAADITRADLAFARAMRTERPRWFRQWVAEWLVFLAAQIALLVVNPVGFLLYVFIPHNFAAWAIVGINYVQHDGCDPSHPYNHSRNLVGPWMNWWFFNNGYHGLHHHEPALHWSLLPAEHARTMHGHVHPNLEVPDFVAYCWRAYVSPGQRVDYLGQPVVLPDEGPDESWIPGQGDTPSSVSLGAEA
ncbi:MAG TPA: fatty acid desaturase [Myxococcota bacterium]|nr:fatty acid desaturase [Myxococcota bacterium]